MTGSAAHAGAKSASNAYIGIGSNLERPLEQVLRARDALADLPSTRLLGFSPLYRNPAVGPGEQPDFVNAVAAIETRLSPHELLAAIQTIEANQGRVREAVRWAPRTLDLDLLVYGDRQINDEGLTVPHPRLEQRAFALKPLLDIAPSLEVPGLGSVRALLSTVSEASLQRIDEKEVMTGKRDDAL